MAQKGYDTTKPNRSTRFDRYEDPNKCDEHGNVRPHSPEEYSVLDGARDPDRIEATFRLRAEQEAAKKKQHK